MVRITHYVRDLAGSVMAIYRDNDLAERPIYGSGRIGVAYGNADEDGDYLYELTDHLGNVRTVFSNNGDAQGESYTDYYPFGMPMPGRNLVGDYRYAFQGQEKDSETDKEAFELRFWDSRIGRWLTTDPAGSGHSPYWGMDNNPISLIDPDGADPWKPGVNDNGDIIYVREGDDNAQTLASQFGLDEKTANKLYQTMKFGVIKGSSVSEIVQGSNGILTLDLASPMANEQRIFDQFLFARDHEAFRGFGSFNTGDFYSNLNSVKIGWCGGGIDGIASMTIDRYGGTIDVFYDIYLKGSNGFGKSSSLLDIPITPYRNNQYGTSLANPTSLLQFQSFKDKNYTRRSADQTIGSSPEDFHLLTHRFRRFVE